jgi:hypothetical protein
MPATIHGCALGNDLPYHTSLHKGVRHKWNCDHTSYHKQVHHNHKWNSNLSYFSVEKLSGLILSFVTHLGSLWGNLLISASLMWAKDAAPHLLQFPIVTFITRPPWLSGRLSVLPCVVCSNAPHLVVVSLSPPFARLYEQTERDLRSIASL